MSNQPTMLKPHDVCIGLQLLLTPDSPYRELAKHVGFSVGEAHNSVKRLEVSHLILPHKREVSRGPFLDFLLYGVPYVYPGELGPETQGVPTAHSAPMFRDRILASDAVVWPSFKGEIRGSALIPLCKKAPTFPESNPALYRLLSILDALRVGRSREREMAREILKTDILSLPAHAG